MQNINRVVISGNLTRDPELRQTASGTTVMGFGLAVNESRKNQQTGEWEEYPNFVDCTMFGTRAESVSQYLHKGGKVAVEGRLHWSQWERDGQKRSKLEVIIDQIELLQARQSGQTQQVPMQQQSASYGQSQPRQQVYQNSYPQQIISNAGAPAYQASVYDEDIPF